MSEENAQGISMSVQTLDTGVVVTVKDAMHPSGQTFTIRHGVTPQFAIGEVSTLPADSAATVSIHGADGTYKLDFGIPKGRNGDNVFTFNWPLSRSGTTVSLEALPYMKTEPALSVLPVEPGRVYEVKHQISTLTLEAKGKEGMYGESTVVVPFGTEPDIDGDNVTVLDKVYSCETHILKVLFVGTSVLVKVLAHW